MQQDREKLKEFIEREQQERLRRIAAQLSDTGATSPPKDPQKFLRNYLLFTGIFFPLLPAMFAMVYLFLSAGKISTAVLLGGTPALAACLLMICLRKIWVLPVMSVASILSGAMISSYYLSIFPNQIRFFMLFNTLSIVNILFTLQGFLVAFLPLFLIKAKLQMLSWDKINDLALPPLGLGSIIMATMLIFAGRNGFNRIPIEVLTTGLLVGVFGAAVAMIRKLNLMIPLILLTFAFIGLDILSESGKLLYLKVLFLFYWAFILVVAYLLLKFKDRFPVGKGAKS